ncbi:response regulator transcription factor [Ktedonobacteria bacterium brp13]|nr:response regulator transcription factor [Ktedonobacteria bacterium brp13]
MTSVSHLPSTQVAAEKRELLRNIQWHVDKRMITIGDVNVDLTITEFSLLFPLRHGTPTTYTELAEMAYNYITDEKVRVMMDKHIDRIRSKLRGTGVYVYCILNYGYLLLPEVNSHNAQIVRTSKNTNDHTHNS